MKKYLTWTGALVLGLVLVGGVASAQGLVPCEGASCGTCELAKLANNILVWIISVMSILCAIVIVVGGFKMVMSAGNSGAVSSGKEMITNAIIGLIILLAAWLIVDTVMKTFVGDTLPQDFGPWHQMVCSTQPIGTGTGFGPGGGTDTGGSAASTTPVAAGTCSVAGLTPLTDPFAIRMEQGSRIIFNNPTLQACVNKFIGQVGGSVTSAYRPPQYQNHLWEINDRWCRQGLRNNTTADCATLKSSIQREVSSHGLGACGAVAQANSSTHGTGMGVDIDGIAHGTARVQAAAQNSCLVWKNYANDPVHYDLISGCTCN